MQVCAVDDATDEEILEVANRENRCFLRRDGWMEVYRGDDANKKPGPCNDHPGRTHFLVSC